MIKSIRIVLFLCVCCNASLYSATITSAQSGNWSNTNTWVGGVLPGPGDNVIIATHIVTANQDVTITDFNLTAGGILTSNGKTLTITGDLTMDGVMTGSLKVILSGTNNISGFGVFNTSGTITLTGGDKTITGGSEIANSEASLSVMIIDAGVTVTNNGFWISAAEIRGNDATTSIWVQGPSSSLRVGKPFITTGTLDASGAGNTIEYFQDSPNQAIKTATGAYHSLTLSGTGNKNLAAAIDINGDLNISSGTFDPNNFDVNIAGSWTNTGGFDEGTGEVIFDGTSDQNISVAGDETYNDLQIFKNSGTVIFENNVNVLGTMLFGKGPINAGGNRLTVGVSTVSIGDIQRTNGHLYNGEIKKWVDAHTGSPFYDLPTGSITKNATFGIRFDNLTPGAIIAEFVETPPGNSGLPLDDGGTMVYNTFSEGYWKVSATDGLTTTGYDLRIVCNTFTSFTLVASTRIVARVNSSSNWLVDGAHANASAVLARRNNVPTIYGNYAIADITNCTAPTPPTITGDDAVCNNDMDIPYSVVDNGDTYTWTIDGGVQDLGGTTNSITVDWGGVGVDGSVAVVATNGCTSSFPVTLPVEVGPLPTSTPPTGKANVADFTLGEPYSVTNNAGHTYTWVITGGSVATGQTTSSITVDWGAAGVGNVNVTGSNVCGSAAPVDYEINIYDVIESAQSGNYGNNNTWTCACSPLVTESFRILATHTVRLTGDETITNAIINPGGILNLNGNDLTVTEDVDVNGFVDNSGDVILSGNATVIDGAGLFQNAGNVSITGGGKTIPSSAALSKVNGDFSIANDLTVTNMGVFTLDGSITGGNANSRFINDANSTLSVSGTLLATGTLIASANGNTVNYTGLVDQIVFPTNYYDLGASGDGIKSLSANTDINGNLQISEDASLDATASDYIVTIAGSWNNISTDADPFVERTSSVVFDGTTLQTLTATIAGGETFYDFTINNAAGATLNDALTISNSMTLSNGIINTSSGNELILVDNATTTVATDFSHIDGPMDKIGDDAFVFPVGDGGSYQAIEISAPGATTDRMQAQYIRSGHPDQVSLDATLDHISDLEYWNLEAIAGTPTVDVTLHWDSYSVVSANGAERNDLRVAHYVGSVWLDQGNDGLTGDETGGTIVVNGMSSFLSANPWTLASISANNALPITLVDFYALQNGGIVEVNWTTSSEINNDEFILERMMPDSFEFESIATVKGAGNSSMLNEYRIMDYTASEGLNYYRLKQVDYDGKHEYSSIISVFVSSSINGNTLSIYPNPSDGDFNLIAPQMDEAMQIIIRDISGKVVYQNEADASTSRGYFNLNLRTVLPKGIYLIQTISSKGILSNKLIVQ